MSTPRTLLIMAAGTGGHIFPGLAIASEMQKRGWRIHWMGTPAGMENKLVKAAGHPLVNINITGVRGKGVMSLVMLPMRLLLAFWQSLRAIRAIRPDVVLSMGGYIAFPGGLMASLLNRPLVVHEPGAVAGIANRTLVPVANRVIVGMEGAFERPVATKWANALPRPKRVEWLGTPVREEIASMPAPEQRFAGRTGKLRLLVVGGSLGAQTMNDLVLAALAAMHESERPEVVHQAGEKLYAGLRESYASSKVAGEVIPFIDDMAARYSWCDVMICRAGAITVAEVSAAGVATILFPLPWFVADEQAANARFLADQGAGISMKQLETKPADLAQALRSLDRGKLLTMANAARSLGKRDATKRCADACEELARAA